MPTQASRLHPADIEEDDIKRYCLQKISNETNLSLNKNLHKNLIVK